MDDWRKSVGIRLNAEEEELLLQRHAPVWITDGKTPDEHDKLWPVCSATYLFANAKFVRHPVLGEDTECIDVPKEIVGHPDRIFEWLQNPVNAAKTQDMASSYGKDVILGEVSEPNRVGGRARRAVAMQEALNKGRGCFGAVTALPDGLLSIKYALLLTFNEANYEDFDHAKHEGDGNHYSDVALVDLTVDASDFRRSRIIGVIMHNHGRQFDAFKSAEFLQNPDGTSRLIVYLEGGSNEAHPNASNKRGFEGHPSDLTSNKWFSKGRGYHSEWKIVGGHSGSGFRYDTQGKVKNLIHPKEGDEVECGLLMLFQGMLGGSYYKAEIFGQDVGPIIDSPRSPVFQPKMWLREFEPPTIPIP